MSKSTKEDKSKKKGASSSSDTKVFERNNKSVRQTRFEEVPDNVSESSDDSTEESGNEARTNSIAIEVNALIPQGEQEDIGTQRVPLVDLKTAEIALKIKVNSRLIKVILDTGSPVTVIRRGQYDAMDREFEEEGNSVSHSEVKNKAFLVKGIKWWQRRANEM